MTWAIILVRRGTTLSFSSLMYNTSNRGARSSASTLNAATLYAEASVKCIVYSINLM